MKYYLAYGSNLNLTQMFRRCPHARVIGHTSLSDMRLVFRGSKTGSNLTVEPDEAASVPCGVFAIQDDDELALDHYEGYAGLLIPGQNGCQLWRQLAPAKPRTSP